MMLKSSLIILMLNLFIAGAFAKSNQPQISLSFPKIIKSNEEIEIGVFVSNLKSATYDLKLALEKDKKIISETYNEIKGEWINSLYYIKNFFTGSSLNKTFKLRLKKEYLFFEGEAEVVLKVRQSGKSTYLEYRDKVKIIRGEIKEEKKGKEIENQKAIFKAEIKSNSERKNYPSILVAIVVAIFSAIVILTLKSKLNGIK